jgi:hypothetical protein
MAQNLISASLPAADAAEVSLNLANAKSKLNFLLSLQTEDVVTLFKVGNAYLPFLDRVYQVVDEHPEILPAVFDVVEFKKDYQLFKTLIPIQTQINELAEGLQKTSYAVGSDALVAALEVYAAVKQHKDKVPGLNATADELAVFFKRTRTKSDTTVK